MFHLSFPLIFLCFFLGTGYAHGEDTEKKEQEVLDMLAAEGTPESLAATPEEMAKIRSLLDMAPRAAGNGTSVVKQRSETDVFPSPRKNRQMVYIRK